MDMPVLARLAEEIKEVVEGGKQLIIVCGSGNFGHHAVKKYGIKDENGVEKVRESAKKVGVAAVAELNKAGVGGRLVVANEIFSPDESNAERKQLRLLINRILADGGMPVFYGDVVGNVQTGWQIFSGEKILARLAGAIEGRQNGVDMIVQAGRERGVLDENGEVIKEINSGNWIRVKEAVRGFPGGDATGGMLHKVEESLEVARNSGVETWIISGKYPGRVKSMIMDKNTEGTRIRA